MTLRPAAPLYLASASPRRLALLRDSGFDPRPCPSGVSEDSRPGESPAIHVQRLAEEKGRFAVERLRAEGRRGLVLAADTVVAIDDCLLGKPRDPAEAARMLRLLAGRTHEVVTGVYLARIEENRSALLSDSTRVRFRPLDDGAIARYIASGEPMDKAGAYAIQGAGAGLVEEIDGSWSNVVGLPMERLPALFCELGVELVE